MGITPNPQQQAIIAFGVHGRGNATVVARAGCGKTSTLVQLSEAIAKAHPRLRQFLGAFNKSIASELQSRIPYSSVTVQTMHAAGLRCYRTLHPRFEIDSRKVTSLARQRHSFDKKSTAVVAEAVGYAKQMGLGLPIDGIRDYTDVAIWRQIFDNYELNDELPSDVTGDRAIESAIWVYGKSIEMCKAADARIDFNDMIFAPLLLAESEDRFRFYDWVMIDEVQDQNNTRRILAERLMRKGGRFMGVGDPKQAIMAFAGADCDSMAVTSKQMGCIEFPLNVTYRCPQSVVRLAQEWVPDFRAHESNPEGKVTEIPHTELWKQQFDPKRDVILCRNRRPLTGIAKRLRRMGVQCVVKGANGKGLIALAEKWGDDVTIEQLSVMLSDYQAKEMKKYMDKGREDKAEAVADRVDILFDLMDGLEDADPVIVLIKRIEATFNDSEDSPLLTLRTVHSSKGLEWERVFLIGRDVYMPSYYALKSKDPETLEQEENLIYVAVTRAKGELVDVVVPARREKRKGDGGNGEKDPEWWEQ